MTFILFYIYLGFCAAILFLFLAARFTGSLFCFDMANFLIPIWMLNPCHVIASFVGLLLTLSERKNPEAKEMIGKKWCAFLWMLLATPLLWLVTGSLIAALTGGV